MFSISVQVGKRVTIVNCKRCTVHGTLLSVSGEPQSSSHLKLSLFLSLVSPRLLSSTLLNDMTVHSLPTTCSQSCMLISLSLAIYLYPYLYIYISIYLYIYLSIYLSICLSIYISIYLYIYISINNHVCQFIIKFG